MHYFSVFIRKFAVACLHYHETLITLKPLAYEKTSFTHLSRDGHTYGQRADEAGGKITGLKPASIEAPLSSVSANGRYAAGDLGAVTLLDLETGEETTFW